jgi:hypothetical protein
MNANQTVRCPNCGSQAERRYFTSEEAAYSNCPGNLVLQTECPVCDYLMVMCSRNGSVVEAYSSGTQIAGVSLRLTNMGQFPISSLQGSFPEIDLVMKRW